jgi:photosystem II stability/assembly factor-like uncharacterized protein/tetratricopeptide (TPR) repeat protein
MSRLRALAALVFVLLAATARATDTRPFEDAPLHAIHFVDKQEGWAAGADGVVWHTIDGGRNWERQPTGTRAALRSICFLNPYTGWVVGREELPNGGGSSGLILATTDGGMHWSRVNGPSLPGLNFVRFFDQNTGLVAGDGSDLFPSGLFATRDGGRSWHPAPGPRSPSWCACDFRDPNTGVLAGAWGRLMTLREGVLNAADVDKLNNRDVRAVRVQGRSGAAVGRNGLVLVSQDSGGDRWGFADLGIGADAAADCDFDAVAHVDRHVWVTGRPGSVVFHSPDLGKTWETQSTGQPLPIHGLHFADAQTGWAAGELGTILGTTDGGKTWTVQRRGGQRIAVLFIHARPEDAALETVALLGAEDGYLTAAVRVSAADPATADPRHSFDPARWLASQRRAGGAAGECLSFPLPGYLDDAGRPELMAAWQRDPASRGDALVRQLVLAIRAWQPEVVVTDAAGPALESIVVESVREAFVRAADSNAFSDQYRILKLSPWQAKKLYAAANGSGVSPVVIRVSEPCRNLGDTPRDFASRALALIVEQPGELPARRSYRLLASTLPGAEGHADLMTGIALAAGGAARRPSSLEARDSGPQAEQDRVLRDRRALQAISQPDSGKLADSGALLAQIGPLLSKLPPDQGASAAFAIANQYARAGRWHLARETFLLMVDRYPNHPLSADAYRWLVAYHSSGEARRRDELGQFLIKTTSDIQQTANVTSRDDPVRAGRRLDSRDLAESTSRQEAVLLSDQAGARKWYESALAVEPRLATVSAMRAEDPAVQFCLQSARRRLGDPETARKWYRQFLATTAGNDDARDNPWRAAAAAELWLAERRGPPPKPVTPCKKVAAKPFLDGKLDDECWRDATPLTLRETSGSINPEYGTTARLAYDNDYFYVAVDCKRPAGRVMPPVEKRSHDDDLRPYDRVGILLDVDRDYQTYFHLQIDERGAIAEDCWGDLTWNPSWFVASQATANGWTAEAAIPLKELAGDAPTIGQAWAVNVVRVVPGRGVHAWSLPADVRPRPEGMGLLLFVGDTAAKP